MKTASLHVYLTFNGNCREAMEFYRNCLGGQLTLQTVGDSPLCNQIPAQMKESILHASLVKDQLVLMGTDMVGEEGLKRGNTVSLMLDCCSEEEIRTCYDKLADGGVTTHPLHTSFWGALFGNLVDRFGNQWLLHFDKTMKPVS